MRKHVKSHSWMADIFFLTLSLGCLFFALLGVRALFTPDEGRYAEIAREMVARGDFVTPYLNGIKYFEKPVLFYWLAAASIKAGGLSLWAIRSVNAILAIVGALFTYVTARVIYNRLTGLLAAIILSTSLLYFVMARMISLDLTVTVFIAATLYSFLLASHFPPGHLRRYLLWLGAVMAGCAVLTKGLIGIVFPVMIILPWLVMTGEWRKLKNYYLPSTALIFLLVALPWHVIVSLRNPEFFYFYFVEQQFLRYTTMDIGHYQPVWFFIPCLIAGFFPWIVFLPQGLLHRFRDRHNQFFLLWALLIFVFFSFSKSKLIPYILPVFPALAILTARYIADACEKGYSRSMRTGFFILVPFSVSIAALFYWFPSSTSIPDKSAAMLYLCSAGVTLVAGSLLSAIRSRQHLWESVVVLIVTIFLFLLMFMAAMPAIDNRTVLPLANAIKPILKPQDEVITYNQYYQELPFYLERRITILNWQNEMTHGMRHQDTQAWMINDQVFWQRWHGKGRVFVFMSQDELKKWRVAHPTIRFYLMGETLNNVVLTNQPPQ